MWAGYFLPWRDLTGAFLHRFIRPYAAVCRVLFSPCAILHGAAKRPISASFEPLECTRIIHKYFSALKY